MSFDLLARVLLAVSLGIFATLWFAVMSGRYPSRRPVDAASFERMTGIYMFAIGLMLVSVLLGLFVDDGAGHAGVILSGFALLGWSQERLVRQAQANR